MLRNVTEFILNEVQGQTEDKAIKRAGQSERDRAESGGGKDTG